MNNTSTKILFNKFEIIDVLKRDVGTSVYLANHIYLNKKIILKTLDMDDITDKTIEERFKREAKILAKLNHPNLIKVLDFGTFDNFIYLSFEYFESKNLRQVIKENNITAEQKLHLAIQLLQALNIAHQNQIIHRDIKPENILVNSRLELKIADFGLALILNDNALTHSSSIVGTPGYMSPEQIRGEKTSQTDLFSAGIVIYELFTGKNPLVGKDVSETINNIINFDESATLVDLKMLPEKLQVVIRMMLKKNLHERAKSVSEVLKILDINEDSNFQVVTDLSEKKNNKKFLYSSISLVLVIIVLLVWSVERNPQIFKLGSDKNPNNRTSEQNSNIAGKSKNNNPNAKKGFDINESSQKNKGNESALVNGTLIKKPGKLFIECSPWANIFIDNDSVDTTPLTAPISLQPGVHNLKLVHANYPPIYRKVKIRSGLIDSVKININNLVGFLDCKVDPWGKIYLNGKFKGITPLQPIVLFPGKYKLTVKNQNYDPITKEIVIKAHETNELKLHFNNASNE